MNADSLVTGLPTLTTTQQSPAANTESTPDRPSQRQSLGDAQGQLQDATENRFEAERNQRQLKLDKRVTEASQTDDEQSIGKRQPAKFHKEEAGAARESSPCSDQSARNLQQNERAEDSEDLPPVVDHEQIDLEQAAQILQSIQYHQGQQNQ